MLKQTAKQLQIKNLICESGLRLCKKEEEKWNYFNPRSGDSGDFVKSCIVVAFTSGCNSGWKLYFFF